MDDPVSVPSIQSKGGLARAASLSPEQRTATARAAANARWKNPRAEKGPPAKKKARYGVYVGRLCPIHLGHQRVIDFMLRECGLKNSLLVIGSSNHGISFRHLFTWSDRTALALAVYPDLPSVGLPDFPSDEEWLQSLWSLIRLRWPGVRGDEVTFFGGCTEDVAFFVSAGYTTTILNRFDGSGPKVSATEVRDALVHGRSTEGLLHPTVDSRVRTQFVKRWEELKRC